MCQNTDKKNKIDQLLSGYHFGYFKIALYVVVIILGLQFVWWFIDDVFDLDMWFYDYDFQIGHMIFLLGLVVAMIFGFLGFVVLKTFSDITKKIKEASHLREEVGQAHEAMVKELVHISQELETIRQAVSHLEFLDDPSLGEIAEEKNSSMVSKYERKSRKTTKDGQDTVS